MVCDARNFVKELRTKSNFTWCESICYWVIMVRIYHIIYNYIWQWAKQQIAIFVNLKGVIQNETGLWFALKRKKKKKREFLVRYEILKLKSRHNVAPWWRKVRQTHFSFPLLFFFFFIILNPESKFNLITCGCDWFNVTTYTIISYISSMRMNPLCAQKLNWVSSRQPAASTFNYKIENRPLIKRI